MLIGITYLNICTCLMFSSPISNSHFGHFLLLMTTLSVYFVVLLFSHFLLLTYEIRQCFFFFGPVINTMSYVYLLYLKSLSTASSFLWNYQDIYLSWLLLRPMLKHCRLKNLPSSYLLLLNLLIFLYWRNSLKLKAA